MMPRLAGKEIVKGASEVKGWVVFVPLNMSVKVTLLFSRMPVNSKKCFGTQSEMVSS